MAERRHSVANRSQENCGPHHSPPSPATTSGSSKEPPTRNSAAVVQWRSGVNSPASPSIASPQQTLHGNSRTYPPPQSSSEFSRPSDFSASHFRPLPMHTNSNPANILPTQDAPHFSNSADSALGHARVNSESLTAFARDHTPQAVYLDRPIDKWSQQSYTLPALDSMKGTVARTLPPLPSIAPTIGPSTNLRTSTRLSPNSQRRAHDTLTAKLESQLHQQYRYHGQTIQHSSDKSPYRRQSQVSPQDSNTKLSFATLLRASEHVDQAESKPKDPRQSPPHVKDV